MKVLVVDDDLDTCEYAALILRRMGIAAKWVLTAREALDQVVDAHERGNGMTSASSTGKCRRWTASRPRAASAKWLGRKP